MHDWLSDHEFKMWLVEVPGDNKLAGCKHYKKSFNLSNMGHQGLVSHGRGQKHQNIIKSISVFTKEKHIRVNTNLSSMSSSNSMKSVANTQSCYYGYNVFIFRLDYMILYKVL